MDLDLDKLKERLKTLENKTSRQNLLWKPKPGDQIIRLLPYQYNESYVMEPSFIELKFHYDALKRNYLSPLTFGRPDPVYEFSKKLKETGSKEDWKLSRKLEPKMRTFAPIVVRGKEQEGVFFWGFGKTVYKELIGIITDPDWGNIADPRTGRDVLVNFKTAKQASGQYPETTIRVKPNQTSITDDETLMENLLNDQPKITDVYSEPSYEELTNALKEWLNPGGESNESSSDEEDNQSSDTEQKSGGSISTGKSSGISGVSDEFDELFED